MKVASCSIVKLENLYIREFVEHQKSIGIDTVFIYDHNEGLEDLSSVIKDYIDIGYVKVINWAGHKMGPAVMEAFQDCWDNYHNEYDWIVFCDIDEYLTFTKDDSIKSYLNRDQFNNFDIIKVNWYCFNDNNLLHYSNEPLQKRFTKPCAGNPKFFYENHHIKCIIRCSTKGIDYINGNAHCPCLFYEPYKNYIEGITHYNDSIRVCDESGKSLNLFNQIKPSKINYISYNFAYFKHYRMKTIEEYVMNKRAKLTKYGYNNIDFNLDLFFKYNKYSLEKKNLYNKLIKNFEKN